MASIESNLLFEGAEVWCANMSHYGSKVSCLEKKIKKIVQPRDPGLPDAAYSPTGARYHMVRIALPENKQGLNPPRYYREGGNVSWVTTGYKTWTIDEWKAAYGKHYLVDVRNWDFFGEEINIWEGYSEE